MSDTNTSNIEFLAEPVGPPVITIDDGDDIFGEETAEQAEQAAAWLATSQERKALMEMRTHASNINTLLPRDQRIALDFDSLEEGEERIRTTMEALLSAREEGDQS
jgi:hypothetical protein